MAGSTHAIGSILDQMHEEAEQDGRVTVQDIARKLGDRGWGPFLFIPAIIEISPIGGIPGVPTLLAAVIAIFAAQIAWGRDCMWLPGLLRRRGVSAESLRGAVNKMRPVAGRLDRWFHGRWQHLTSDRALRVAAVLVLLLCLSVPPLELFPFASTVPMTAIAMFGLGFTLRDGLLMALGFLLSLGAIAVAVWFAIGG